MKGYIYRLFDILPLRLFIPGRVRAPGMMIAPWVGYLILGYVLGWLTFERF